VEYWDVMDRFSGMDRFKGELRVNSVIIDVIIDITYSSDYMQVFPKYKYSIYTYVLYQIISLNVITSPNH